MVERHSSAGRLMRNARLLIDATLAMDGDEADIEGALRSLRQLADRLLATLARVRRDVSAGESAVPRPRVLVVDDVAEVRDLVAMVLEREGFEVFTAADGLEALVVAHATRPTIILMDVTMPVLDGIEATRLLKAAALTRHVPVIAHTGVPASCAEAADPLFVQVLSKPVDPSVLVALVRGVLRQPPRPQA